ncbi:hypothetical protein BTH73_07380 [Lactobacillus delbrueckii subsp. bulgaricus]|nr:hypothetical protein [Lactobacillus delbrueckii subsp. bulgaricus]MBT9000175.1 hypothetical protein [Lactobacillus delbrueckii subsp. bulgaricus]MBT9025639.1 hypothetical protein [Lactobacillus delbrueckii subsp. bulgaricus]MBT9075099.1 hypothetical protein [Lactobacillus delbrueckii subsp. bulgaricus]
MQGTINPVSDYIVVERVIAEEVVNHRIGQANTENRHEVTGLVVVGHAFFDDLSQQHCNIPRNLTNHVDFFLTRIYDFVKIPVQLSTIEELLISNK